MPTVIKLQLFRPSMGTPVQYTVLPDDSAVGQPGVTAIVVHHQGLGWCLLADHPKNPGASVTNSAERYADTVCQALIFDLSDLAWFELDSDGCFDQLQLLGGSAAIAPILENGTAPRSLEAFMRRVSRLAVGIPPDAVTAVTDCLARFRAH